MIGKLVGRLLEQGFLEFLILDPRDRHVDAQVLRLFRLPALQKPDERLRAGNYHQPQQNLFCFRTQFIASKINFSPKMLFVNAFG
jgi:hypothetical protein